MTAEALRPETAATVRSYLHRLGADDADSHTPDLALLQRLTAAHCAHVPFETLHRAASVAVAESVERIAGDERGGICYHLDGSFAWLLRRLGFDATVHPAGTQSRFRPDPQEPNGTHVVIIVSGLPGPSNPDGQWLVDVGSGEGPAQPLPLVAGDHRVGIFRYCLRPSDLDPSWWRLDHDRRQSCRGIDFSTEPVDVESLDGIHTTMAETDMAIFFDYGWVKRHTPEGYDELIGCRLSHVDGAGRSSRTIDDRDDYLAVLRELFGLSPDHLDPEGPDALWERVHTAWSAQEFADKWTAARS